LERYGRTDVDFYKIDEETFYMDFSVNIDWNEENLLGIRTDPIAKF
jgi:hypothetical protein